MTSSYVRRSGFAVVPNSTIHDRRLSLGALGLLTYLLAVPPGAATGYRDLERQLGIGQHVARKFLGELTAAGYRHVIRVQAADGAWRTYAVNSDTPCSPDEAREAVDNRPVTVRGNSTLGVTSGNGASAQVGPSVDYPGVGRATHVPTGLSTPSGNSQRGRSGQRSAVVDKAPPALPAAGEMCDHGWSSAGSSCPHCPGGRLSHLSGPA